MAYQFEREIQTDAPDVWRVIVGWSRNLRSYWVAIEDLTGKDPNRRARDGICYEAGLEGEFPTLQKFVDHTKGTIRWDLNPGVLDELRDWPWQAEREWVERKTPSAAELLASAG
jgi:hypothetical protein